MTAFYVLMVEDDDGVYRPKAQGCYDAMQAAARLLDRPHVIGWPPVVCPGPVEYEDRLVVLLGTVKQFLEKLPADRVLTPAFGEAYAFRGYYDEVAFHPVTSSTVTEMLGHVNRALVWSLDGYHGGTYTYDETSRCHIANYGCDTADGTMAALLKAWKAQV